MNRQNSPANFGACGKDVIERLLLQSQGLAALRRAVQPDLSHVPGLGQQRAEQVDFVVPLGNQLGVQTERDAHAWCTSH